METYLNKYQKKEKIGDLKPVLKKIRKNDKKYTDLHKKAADLNTKNQAQQELQVNTARVAAQSELDRLRGYQPHAPHMIKDKSISSRKTLGMKS
jgi:hypothetical protein